MMNQIKHVYFTEEQERWLFDNYNLSQSYRELTDRFNRNFGTYRTKESVREKCTKRLKLKGMKNPTSYGIKTKEQLPIGTIRKSKTGTYIKVRDSLNGHFSGYKEPYWMPIQKKIYEDAYGKIPRGKMICFLDGNPENLHIENLYPVDRKISAIMSKNKWWTKSKEHTITAIKWCELYYALKDIEKDGEE